MADDPERLFKGPEAQIMQGPTPAASAPEVKNQLAASGSTVHGSLTITDVPRELMMHRVTEEELHTLRGVVPVTAVAFLGASVGAALTFWSVLHTAHLTGQELSDVRAYFFGARVALVFFLIVSAVGYYHLFRVVSRIKRRPQPNAGGDRA